MKKNQEEEDEEDMFKINIAYTVPTSKLSQFIKTVRKFGTLVNISKGQTHECKSTVLARRLRLEKICRKLSNSPIRVGELFRKVKNSHNSYHMSFKTFRRDIITLGISNRVNLETILGGSKGSTTLVKLKI